MTIAARTPGWTATFEAASVTSGLRISSLTSTPSIRTSPSSKEISIDSEVEVASPDCSGSAPHSRQVSADAAVHRARIEVGEAEPFRDRARNARLAGAGRPVDRDYQLSARSFIEFSMVRGFPPDGGTPGRPPARIRSRGCAFRPPAPVRSFPTTGPFLPRIGRRILGITLELLAFVLMTVLSPLIMLVAAAVDLTMWITRRKPWVYVRLLPGLWVFLFGEIEALVKLPFIYVLTGGPFGTRVDPAPALDLRAAHPLGPQSPRRGADPVRDEVRRRRPRT